jgi:hypothetical protein
MRTLLIVVCLFVPPAAAVAATRDTTEAEERRIMDILVGIYGATDWSAVDGDMVAHPAGTNNPNVMVIPLSLGNGYLGRYEVEHDLADFERALAWFEFVGANHALWGQRWLAPAVAHYLDVSALRLRIQRGTGVYFERVQALWRVAMDITEQEADARLGADLPYKNSPGVGGPDPYDSSTTGDTKAEENAWEAVVLAAAANFLPDHPHAADWDRRARQLAYDAVTTPSDPPDSAGIKTTTVPEDFALANHGKFPNPYYMAATLFLLCQGALSYRLTNRAVPEEFGHNVVPLYAKYQTYVDSSLGWTVPAHPTGDATLFPLPFDPVFETAVVAAKSALGDLWKPTAPVAILGLGDDLWQACQNAKVVLYHLMGSYLWHVTPWLVQPPPMPESDPGDSSPQIPGTSSLPSLIPSKRIVER